jgi:hypothetical protein
VSKEFLPFTNVLFNDFTYIAEINKIIKMDGKYPYSF